MLTCLVGGACGSPLVGDVDPKPFCGDGVKSAEEDCDDGNDDNEDGCPNSCSFKLHGLNVCPTVTGFFAGPLQAEVGGAIVVQAQASDANGDSLTYAWTATAGRFDDSARESTTYECTVAGQQQLTLTVTDARGCAQSWQTRVDCL